MIADNYEGIGLHLADVYMDLQEAIQTTEWTEDEASVLPYILKGYNNSEISQVTGIHRLAIPEIFAKICIKLQRVLGSEYTTEMELLND